MHKKLSSVLLALLVAIPVMVHTTPVWAAQGENEPPDWLEPRGLSVVDLVGLIPDHYLQGTVLSYADGSGIVVYESGVRHDNSVSIVTTIYPRVSSPTWVPDGIMTTFGCLGQRPYFDHIGSVAPPSKLQVYDRLGREITAQIQFLFITNMETRQPMSGSSDYNRYLPEEDYGHYRSHPLPLGADGLSIPANSGCRILIPGEDLYPLTGIFALQVEHGPQASVVGTQSAAFHSYIGPGQVGIFQPLMQQLRGRYPDRNGRIPLSIPPLADYLLVKFPPHPGDPFSDMRTEPPYANAHRLGSGSYRLSGPAPDLPRDALSTDLVFSAAMPLRAVWRDADQSPNSLFLPEISGIEALAPPEYVLPPEIEYDACFTVGNCSPEMLQQIYDAVASLEIIYLAIERPATGVSWHPLRLAGENWPRAGLGAPEVTQPLPETQGLLGKAPVPAQGSPAETHRTFLPLVFAWGGKPELTDCPCGWFDHWGRMLDYSPRPEADTP